MASPRTAPTALIVAVALLFSVLEPTAAPPRSPWRDVVNRVAQSAAYVDTPETVCTAISIGEAAGMFLTAAHCQPNDNKSVTVDGHPALIVWVDAKLDLMVLASPAARRRAIAPRFDTLVVGEEVALYGHGLGAMIARFRTGRVSALDMPIPVNEGEMKVYTMLDTAALPGMSGGPVVDVDGRLVGVMLISSYVESGIAPMSVVMKTTRQWWD
jgi:S1-C subfamily serine protease